MCWMCSEQTGCAFLRRGSRQEDQRPSILQKNTERFTTNKISIIKQLGYKNKALIIPQEVHCTIADKLQYSDT